MSTDPRRGRRQFLLLAALFAAPLLAAWLLYAVFPELRPAGKTHQGQLVDPARPIPAFAFVDAEGLARDAGALKGKWSYVYLAPAACGPSCAEKLHQIRQVRTLLNEKRPRVRRVYLAAAAGDLPAARAALAGDHPDLIFLAPRPGSPDPAAFFTGGGGDALYLVDPLGNWLMTYPATAESRGLLKDIKKLLRVSQIG